MQSVNRVKEFRWTFLLTKNAKLSDGQLVVDQDADFEWRAYKWGAKVAVSPTLNFTYRLSDHRGRPLQSGFQDTLGLFAPLGSGNEKTSGDGTMPAVIWPPRVIPCGGAIRIELQETTGNNNTTTLVMLTAIGVKRYRGD